MNIRVLLLAVAFSISFMQAQDTEAERMKEAERYLTVVPMKEMLADMVEKMKVNQPPEKQAWIEMIFSKYVDYQALENIAKDGMVKSFTADELKALTDFYASPIGKSAMKKFGVYMAAIMPPLQAELRKAVEKSQYALPRVK